MNSFTAGTSLPKQYDTYDFIDPSRFAGKLDGKVVVITGASAGLGRVSCLAFAKAGARLACVARRQEQLDTLVDEITTKHHVPALAVVADVSDAAAAPSIVSQTEQHLGHVDVLLNCAGITRFGNLAHEEDLATWWRLFEVNVRGPVALTHAVLPSMIARQSGTIITVASTAGSLEMPCVTGYGASKAAVIKFQQDLALEVARHGIRSYSLHPGTVTTEMGATETAINQRSMQEEPVVQELLKEFQGLRYQSPQLMADTAVALCADERFRALNGRYIDCEQPLDLVLKEAEKEGGGRIGREGLYKLNVREL